MDKLIDHRDHCWRGCAAAGGARPSAFACSWRRNACRRRRPSRRPPARPAAARLAVFDQNLFNMRKIFILMKLESKNSTFLPYKFRATSQTFLNIKPTDSSADERARFDFLFLLLLPFLLGLFQKSLMKF